MASFNIYVTGVGGQGIGMLSEVLLRAVDHAGYQVKAVDTHGLAQRGGIVVSQIRLGDGVYSPLIREGDSDLVIALERYEAYRALTGYLKSQGTLIYYDTVWQPLDIRLDAAGELTPQMIVDTCRRRGIRCLSVYQERLDDVRMQNMVLLAHVDKNHLIPGVSTEHYHQAMSDLMGKDMLQKNKALFDRERK